MLRPALGRARGAAARSAAWWLPGAVLVALATGLLPLTDARQVGARIWSVLAFLVAVTVVAELADAAGLFEAAADVATRAGRGSVPALWLLVVALATATTVLLSLDTTAVLLTPVVLALAQRLALPPAPFALVTVWLANTASLLLPVSNLTNLLAVGRTGRTAGAWAAHAWAPALAAVVATVAVARLIGRRRLRGRYDRPDPRPAGDRLLLGLAAAACLGLGVGVAAGAPPWLAALVAAAVLVAGFAVRRRDRLVHGLVPLRLVVATACVFLLVATAERHGLAGLLRDAVGGGGGGDGAGDLLRVAGVGAAAANAVNNLPAYLAVEPAVAGDPARLLALVIGVNAGAVVTPWSSLAVLLWRERCRARGVSIGTVRFAGYGILVAAASVTAAVLALDVAG